MAKRSFLKKLWSMCYLSAGGFAVYSCVSINNENEKFYREILMPLVHRLNPETAHNVAIQLAKYNIFPKTKFVDPPVLETIFLGKTISNPVGVAAGLDKHGEAVNGLTHLGFGFIEIGSVTPLPQDGNPKPRVFRLPEDGAIINRYGFNSDGYSVVYERLLKQLTPDCSCKLLGVNLGKNKESLDHIEDYVSGIKTFGQVADYLVINVSSPNTPGLRNLQEKDNLQKLLSAAISARNELPDKKPPILLKLAPDLSQEDKTNIATVISKKQCKVDGLIISNTSVQRNHLENAAYSQEEGGLSGKPLQNMSTELIRDMYKLTKGSTPIIGVGGVFSGQDAYEKILAGASVVQIYSAFIYGGPPAVTKIKTELAECLIHDGYRNVNEAVGKQSSGKKKSWWW